MQPEPQRCPRLVVFDMAGTTVRDDDAVNRCLRTALDAAGVSVSAAAVNAVMGLPKPEAIRSLLQRESVADKTVIAVHENFLVRMQSFYRDDPAVAAVNGATAVFAILRAAGVKVALDTGFSRPIAATVLARLGWTSAVIDASVTSDEVTNGRPHPDMVFHLMRVLDVTDLADVAKIGDTPADLHEGAAAGCGWNIGITSGTHSRAELATHPHTHLIDDLRELIGLFGL